MSFTQYNNKHTFKKIEWNVNTKDFTFKKLSDLYSQGVKTIQVFGFFFTKSDKYGPQPIAITKDCLVNLPTHKRDVITNMIQNDDCVNAIKKGECSLELYKYKSKYNEVCFDFDFIDSPTTSATPKTTEEKIPDIF